MLETKRVVAYGKRSSRIVYISNDTRVSHESPNPRHRTSRENTTSTSPSTLRKALSRGRKVHGLSTSPRGSPKSGNIFGLASKKTSEVYAGITPSRRPLGPKNVVPPSPSILYLGQKAARASDAKLTTFSPFVDSDTGMVGRPKRRVTGRPNKVDEGRIRQAQQAKDEDEAEVVRPSRRRAVKKAIVLSDSEDEDEDDDDGEFKPIQSRRGARVNPIVISDDESDDDPEFVHPKLGHDSVAPLTCGLPLNAPREQHQPPPKRHSPCLKAEVSILTTKLSSQSKQSRGKGLLLPAAALPKSVRVPRRNLRNPPRLKEPHNPLSATLDLERSFAALSLSADAPAYPPLSQAPPGPSLKTSTPALHLAALLAECGQRTPQFFSTFVQTFPLDDVHESRLSVDLTFRKIGEASYSEVFAIGNVVIKIIPLRDESRVVHQTNGDVDTPQESDVKDVLQEVIVTREMGRTCPGFIKLHRTYVVVGKYPPSLLALWDDFNGAKHSENVRPDVFPSTQTYALLVLPHGGPDLEAYSFPMKAGWRQACSIFWQIAKALATAEELVSFEHRDLHWGQILVKGATLVRKKAPRALRGPLSIDIDDANGFGSIPMDHPHHGVTATIIDLGLARMSARNGNDTSVHWTPFDDLTFEGEGDYQFDVYRMMRHVHGEGAWARYCPLTNVMWLHYLTLKLLRSKRLRPPGPRNTTPIIGAFNEKQCYDCLIEMEQLLANCIPQLKGKKYRGATKGMFAKAGDVMYFAKGRGWLD